MMRVAVVGTGYVGLVSGACLADKGHLVTCVDVDARKVESINAGRPTIHETGLDTLLARVVPDRMHATLNLEAAVAESDVTIIAVGTPFDGTQIDLSQIRAAAEQIGRALRDHDGYPVVVVKSTVVPGTTDEVVLPLLERTSGMMAGRDFGIGMNPEFLKEGDAIADFMAPDRIVLGGIDARTLDRLEALYASFPGTEIVRTDPRTAEMIKYASNALLATLISYSNEIANLGAELGVDTVDVLRGVRLDRRISPIGENGERIFPGLVSYLAAGCGFGGSCFPKDVRALVAHGRSRGEEMPLLSSVVAVNEAQPNRLIAIAQTHSEDSRIG